MLCSLLVLGCGAPPKVVRTYMGAARPTTEVAVVRAKRNGIFAGGALAGFAINVAAIEVDGEPVPTGAFIWQAPPDIELEPGTHSLTLAVDQGGNTRTVDYPRPTLVFEAGHLYELRGRLIASSMELGLFETRFAWEWWIVDVTTGKTVASDASGSPP
jgi:hypothetical protein